MILLIVIKCILPQLVEHFMHVLDALYWTLNPLIVWPDREALTKTMPKDFRKHFPNCVVKLTVLSIDLTVPQIFLLEPKHFVHTSITIQ